MTKFLHVPVRPCAINVPRLVKKTGLIKKSTAYLVPPHRVWSEVHKFKNQFRALFGSPDDWEHFWQAHAEERWMTDHPHRALIQSKPRQCCPWLLYGDDAQTSKRVGRTCGVLLWFSPLSEIRGMDGMVPLCVVDNDEPTIQAINNELYRGVVWSFRHAALNINPVNFVDRSLPLPKDMELLAGKSLTKDEDLHLVCTQLKGWPVVAFVARLGLAFCSLWHSAFSSCLAWLSCDQISYTKVRP